MTNKDGLGDALRAAIGVPTDTMITLDIPLLLTKLSQVPPVPTDHAADKTPPGPDADAQA